MAIPNGIIKKMTGSAGQLTFKTVNGQTVVSEKGDRGEERAYGWAAASAAALRAMKTPDLSN